MGTWKRPWEGAETRLLHEWLALKHPEADLLTHVRVGPVEPAGPAVGLSEAEWRALGVFRRWVDALVVHPDRLIVVEACILPSPAKMGQLEYYMALVPQTPELAYLGDLPPVGLLLTAQDDPILRGLAGRKGFLWEVYCPPWVTAYLAARVPRRNRATSTP